MMRLQNGGIFLRHTRAYKDKLVNVYGEIHVIAQVHQGTDRSVARWDFQSPDVQRVLAYVPTAFPEGGADRTTGKNFRVRVFITVVRVFGKLDNRVSPANLCLTVIAEQTRASQPRLTCQHFDTVATEALLNPFAIENDRLGCTGAENSGQNTGREV